MGLFGKKDDQPDVAETAVAGAPDPDDAAATAEPPLTGPPRGESPLSAQAASNGAGERPEILVGAAFVGGFALAQIMKRFGK